MTSLSQSDPDSSDAPCKVLKADAERIGYKVVIADPLRLLGPLTVVWSPSETCAAPARPPRGETEEPGAGRARAGAPIPVARGPSALGSLWK